MKNKLLLLLLSASILTACQNDTAKTKEEAKNEDSQVHTEESSENITDDSSISFTEGDTKQVLWV